MRKTSVLLLIVVMAAALALFSVLLPKGGKEPAVVDVTPDVSIDAPVLAKEYVQTHLSELSSQKEVLGGTFYVTSIEARGGRGTVSYEDGHNAFVADFAYEVDGTGRLLISSFVIRK